MCVPTKGDGASFLRDIGGGKEKGGGIQHNFFGGSKGGGVFARRKEIYSKWEEGDKFC